MSNDVNFKRLDELEVIESSAENAHVLAEVNGVPKRIPASSVGGGKEMVEKVLYDGPEVDRMDIGGRYFIAIVPLLGLESGKTYTVNLDGEVHELTSETYEISGQQFVILGNAGLDPYFGLADTGESIAVTDLTQGDPATVIATTKSEPFENIKVTTMVEKTSGGMMRINVTLNDDDTYSADKTYAEIAEAITSGIVPYCVLGTDVYMLSFSGAISDMATYFASNAHKFTHFSYWYPTLHEIVIEESNKALYHYVTLQQVTES